MNANRKAIYWQASSAVLEGLIVDATRLMPIYSRKICIVRHWIFRQKSSIHSSRLCLVFAARLTFCRVCPLFRAPSRFCLYSRFHYVSLSHVPYTASHGLILLLTVVAKGANRGRIGVKCSILVYLTGVEQGINR